MPKPIGRPQKTSAELRKSGARAGRIKAREAQERIAAGIVEEEEKKVLEKRGLLLETFLAQVKQERDTFFERLVPNQTVCKDYEGDFGWPSEHPLTVIKAYAEQITNGQIVSGELTRRACVRFLGDLANGADRELFIDPVAIQNIETWFATYGEPGLKLQPWELFIVGQILGWKRTTGLRRFREAWWEVAKKNGKTALMGGLALFLTIADQELNAEVYSLANARHQAKLCFKAAQHWHEANVELRENVKSFISSFVFGGSTYQFLSSESKTADGPNVAAAFFDEVHEFDNDELFEKITAGCIARSQPLVVSSTTAGNRPESFGGLRHEFFERLLLGLFENDTKFAVIYALDAEDDWKDESLWIKANPNLGVTVKIEGLRDEVEDIKQYPSSKTSFLRYHCNRWSTAQEGHSLPPENVAACKGMQTDMSPKEMRNWFLETYANNRCYGGFDYGETSDMCSFVLIFPGINLTEGESSKLVCIPYYWIPEMEVDTKEKQWRVPLQQWVKDGWIRTTPGNIADPADIRNDLVHILDNYRVRDTGYDGWGGVRTMMAGFTEQHIAQCTEVRQIPGLITPPAKEFKLAVMNGTFAHLNNPVLMWNCLNVQLEMDEKNGGMMPRKAEGSTRKKIDGVQATITAMQRYMDKDANPWSIYNERGILTLEVEDSRV